ASDPNCEVINELRIDLIGSDKEIYIKKIGVIKINETIPYEIKDKKKRSIRRKLIKIDVQNQTAKTQDYDGTELVGCSMLLIK
ncbi:MAG: hypothetical protein H7836_18060, partial [Magnetococcus sp. YQC-3]